MVQDLLFARLQMALSLGFHIVFASVGIAMPFFMAISHYKWLRSGNPIQLELTKAWSRGVAIFFATGAVSGTALSLELGLLWPRFMEHAGPIIGMPFSLEGAAFFIEAIALGLFLYGWKKIHPWLHWICGVIVGVAGVASGMFVVCANAWMNAPAGFDWINGSAHNINPVAAMFNRASLLQGIHMTIAAFQAVGFAVAGTHAFLLLKNRAHPVHREALSISLMFAVAASFAQPIAGHFIAEQTAELQPVKLAAMESLFETTKGAPAFIGGIPNMEARTVDYGIEVPGLLSFLAKGSFDATVQGLNDFPRDEWPPVLITHIAFQIMVGVGTMLAGLSILFFWGLVRRRDILLSRWCLALVSFCTPMGFLALEAGWTVTEVGRQPWVIYKIMRTSEALTPMPGLVYPFLVFLLLYLFLTLMIVWLMVRQIRALGRGHYGGTP